MTITLNEVNRLGSLSLFLYGCTKDQLAEHIGITRQSIRNKDIKGYWTVSEARALGFDLYFQGVYISEGVNIFKTVMETLGLSLKELTAKLGCSMAAPYHWEKNNSWLMNDLQKLGFTLEWEPENENDSERISND